MSENERDSHFAKFANNLWMELVQSPDWPFPAINMAHYEVVQLLKTIIARRAYDLVEHALENQPIIPHIASGIVLSNEEIIKEVPDLTEWPE